jgi:hypothetical protein
MSDWAQTVEHGAASARHETDIKRDVEQAIQQARREERERIIRLAEKWASEAAESEEHEIAEAMAGFASAVRAMSNET